MLLRAVRNEKHCGRGGGGGGWCCGDPRAHSLCFVGKLVNIQ